MTSHLSLEALAASQLMAALREQGEDDDEVLATAVEGETSFLESVDAALAELGDIDAMIEAIGSHEVRLAARAARLLAKRDRIKQQLLAAIECAGVPTPLRRPCATVSVTKGRRRVLVLNEAEIPPAFMRETVVRKPDTAAITEALAEGRAVFGACLSNACPSLTIRTR